ncbi:MAG TPA: lysylphosphatidylglycerol synthase transmembrane domain-containing protein [Vicinamibacterales bacterium]|nr:lysylphosphatidylglycerol synthase transmembrane domain-containing protein [Vicinamibacterales bacterium]
MPADTSESSRPSPARRYVLLALKISVSIVLLGLLFSRIDVSRLWATARLASVPWLLAALVVYAVNVIAAVWRWQLLLNAQRVVMPQRTLLGSFLVAAFFNNFLPSNIGGDVIRIGDTARAAGSKTLATMVVLVDRGLGLMALVLVAALGASAGVRIHPAAAPIWPVWLWAGFLVGAVASAPAVLAPDGFGRLLQPLTVFHPEWVGDRIEKLTGALARFREQPGALAGCFGGAVFVQATMVVFYFAVAYALHLDIQLADLAVVVPVSFVVQMLPVSVNGFGVREATFSFYFSKIGHPIESALLLSLVAQALVMLFSLIGAVVYVYRSHHHTLPPDVPDLA